MDRQNADTAHLREQVGQLKVLGDAAKLQGLFDRAIGRGLPQIPAELFLEAYRHPPAPAATEDSKPQRETADAEGSEGDADDGNRGAPANVGSE